MVTDPGKVRRDLNLVSDYAKIQNIPLPTAVKDLERTYGKGLETFKPVIPESYSGDFTPYNSLTEEQIISWIESQIPEEKRKEMESQVAKKIAKFYDSAGIGSSTTYKSPVPW